ncbi:MAG: hypothetical protein ACPGWR_32005, partial [Ardenticatenaceae bacterium]
FMRHQNGVAYPELLSRYLLGFAHVERFVVYRRAGASIPRAQSGPQARPVPIEIQVESDRPLGAYQLYLPIAIR